MVPPGDRRVQSGDVYQSGDEDGYLSGDESRNVALAAATAGNVIDVSADLSCVRLVAQSELGPVEGKTRFACIGLFSNTFTENEK